MTVTKVDARRNPSITLNEILSRPLNNPDWIDTKEANRIFDTIQENNFNKRDYITRETKLDRLEESKYGFTELLLECLMWFKYKF